MARPSAPIRKLEPSSSVGFAAGPGQVHDMKGMAPLIQGGPNGALLADKAFDVN